jgi:hypothetical protein
MKRPGISVFASGILNVAEICQATGERLPHMMLTVVRAELIISQFEVEPTLDPPHYTVWLDEDRDELLEIERFRDLLGDPVKRPVPPPIRTQGGSGGL